MWAADNDAKLFILKYYRNITIHHNNFENCFSRIPLDLFGTGYVFNNYCVEGYFTAVNSRIKACLCIENKPFIGCSISLCIGKLSCPVFIVVP
jgi:pectate lyase